MAEYSTYEAAMDAVEVAIKDTIKDQPHLKDQEDDVYHDMVQAIMPDCEPELMREIAQRTGVPVPPWLSKRD